ncbi:MAG TPA: adenylate/guanylate cyclase domain-containing protein [Chitinophagaceae bacterium]|nr:adenylate/guanylate cyclase domain-containing protein [Chitinophagaceae bacterium]
MPEHSHQLAAILFADIVNYTAMMQKDENSALEKITRFRHVIDIIVEELEGKIIQYYGDGCLVLFNSATDAVEFAKLLQTDFNEDPKVPVRIGIHMGDVLLRDGNVFGDVVNIASRIQALAPEGGIYVSEVVYRNIANKKGMDSVFIKEEFLKNVKQPIRIYEVLTEYSKTVYHTGPNDEQVAIDENSIAVLPFVNMSSDKEQEYFSDGLTEDIITQLSKIKSFKVISRTSVMQYKKTPKSIREIGKELGVATIVEGSVQRSPTQVRITAQLINAVTDEHLWSESYDRPVDDIFTIQREVALAIASVLNTTLTRKESQQLDYVPTVNLQAYDVYMRGKFLVEKRNKTDLLVARELFQQAVARDRTFADAYSGLATTYLLSSFRGYEDPTRMLWLAKKNIDTALGLDPSSGEIQATLGYWYHQTFDWHAAEITYRRAIDLNANQSNVYLWLGILLEAKEEKEEALKIYSRGTELNPMWDYLVENRIRALVNNNQSEEGIALQKGLIEKASVDPSLKKIYYEDLSRLYWFLNDKKEAIAAAEKSKNKALLKFYNDGDHSLMEKEVDKHYAELRDKSEYVSQTWMGIDYARAGAREKALDCFNNAIALKETAITFLLLRHFDFLNIKYLSMALITRKIRQTINF